MNRQRTALVLSLAAMIAGTTARAETMRCGQSLVNEESSVAELLQKCGEPQEKTRATEDVYAVNASGHRYKTGAVTTTERWIYQRTPNALPMAVTIIDGKIKSVARVE